MNIPPLYLLVGGTLCAALGMWLMLPRGGRRGRWVGVVLGLLGMYLLGAQVPRLAHPVDNLAVQALALVTVVSAVGAVTMSSPVYCAIWFALTLVGTSALMLITGAQFLGVATIVVYAGAILVTFLFVLMLAQPQGLTYYDRLSWEALLSSAAGAVLVGMLTMTLAAAFGTPEVDVEIVGGRDAALAAAGAVFDPLAEGERQAEILHPEHVARLGASLYSRHLVSVEAAGALLLVALVGAVGIAAQQRGVRPAEFQGVPHA